MKKILNDSSKFHKVYIDHDKILNHLTHMENRVTDVLKNLRDKKEISMEQYKDFKSFRFNTWNYVWFSKSP